MLPLNFKNFFPHLVIHPDDATEGGDRNWAWVASVILGIFTLGTVHAGCALYEWCSKKKPDDLNSAETKTENTRKEHNLGQKHQEQTASVSTHATNPAILNIPQKDATATKDATPTKIVPPDFHQNNPFPQPEPQKATAKSAEAMTPTQPLNPFQPASATFQSQKVTQAFVSPQNFSKDLPRGFNVQAFKENALARMSNRQVEQTPALVDLNQVVLTKDHWKILQGKTKDKISEEEKAGRLKIVSWQYGWAVIEFPDLPNVELKIKLGGGELYTALYERLSVDIMGRALFGAENAPAICAEHNLFLLDVPKTRLVTCTADDLESPMNDDTITQVLIQEKMDCPFPSWQEQEQIYRYIQNDPDLQEYSEALLQQLLLFTVVTGFSNPKYDKIPILPNGKIGLHELCSIAPWGGRTKIKDLPNPQIQPGIYGLYASGCEEERGLFSHILPAKRPAFKTYALDLTRQYLPEKLEFLTQKFRRF